MTHPLKPPPYHMQNIQKATFSGPPCIFHIGSGTKYRTVANWGRVVQGGTMSPWVMGFPRIWKPGRNLTTQEMYPLRHHILPLLSEYEKFGRVEKSESIQIPN